MMKNQSNNLPPVIFNRITPLLGSDSQVNFTLAVTLAAVASLYYSDIDPEQRPVDTEPSSLLQEYDFIIVGGGSAGSVLTNRLSEVRDWNILLIEAGGDETALSDLTILPYSAWFTAQDWNYTTTPQQFACRSDNEGRCRYPRGRGLGGSSAINALIYVRGNRQDYDGWEAMGNPGWGYSTMLQYFLRSEDNQNASYYGSPYHRTGGYQTVSDARYRTPVGQAVLNAAKDLGYDIVDYNGERQVGFSWGQYTYREGSRCSTAKGFLRPTRSRTNVHISQNSMVSQILIDPENMTAYGVQFTRDNVTYEVRASREVILSAGSLNSAQLLMLSGIGPSDQLNKFNITTLKTLPVGQNLQDHQGIPYLFRLDGISGLNNGVWATVSSVLEYAVNRTGPMSSTAIDCLGFVNSNVSVTDVPNVQYHVVVFPPHSDNRIIVGILALILHPNSRGQVTLQSNDINVPPLIDTAYYTAAPDFDVQMWASNLSFALAQTPSLQKYNATIQLDFYPSCQNVTGDDFLRCTIQHYTETIYHPVGTCKMGPSVDKTAVVNPQLQVYGVKGLRVIDASIMPIITRGNTNAPVIAIAERASDMVKIFWNRTEGVLSTMLN